MDLLETDSGIAGYEPERVQSSAFDRRHNAFLLSSPTKSGQEDRSRPPGQTLGRAALDLSPFERGASIKTDRSLDLL